MHFASRHAFLGAPAGGCFTLRGMRFWARPPGEAFRFGGCVYGRARRERHHASGHAFLGVPAGEMHFTSEDAFQGPPAVRDIPLRSMRFRARPP